MELQIGDRVIWEGNEGFTNPNNFREGTITKKGKEGKMGLVFVDYQHKPEDCIYADFCWPIAAKAELQEICRKRGELKRAYDDSMKLIYELRNKVSRGEI